MVKLSLRELHMLHDQIDAFQPIPRFLEKSCTISHLPTGHWTDRSTVSYAIARAWYMLLFSSLHSQVSRVWLTRRVKPYRGNGTVLLKARELPHGRR